MKKIIVGIIIFFSLIISTKALEINSKNAILYNLDNNKVIYEKNSDEIISIASLTKIMTMIVAIENIDNLDQKVIITNKDFDTLYEENASLAGLYVGEELTYRDLLYATFLPSGADGAQALANNISGSIPSFVNLMNNKAKEIGMNNTKFANPTGLDNKDNYSTVADVIKLLIYAKENPTFYEIFTSNYYTLSDGYKTLSNCFRNTGYYYNYDTSYILGAKPGYTDDAGKCLASLAIDPNNITYALVVCGASTSSDDAYHLKDTTTIYKYFFNNYNNNKILSSGDTLFITNCPYNKKCKFTINEDIFVYTNSDFDINKVAIDIENINNIKISSKQGELVATLNIIYDGNIIAKKSINLQNEYIFSIKDYLLNTNTIYFFTFVIGIKIIKKKRKHRNFLKHSKLAKSYKFRSSQVQV